MTVKEIVENKLIDQTLIWPKSEFDQIPAGENYHAWNVNLWDNFQNRDWLESATYIAKWGILAPSSHNIQPWVIYLDERERTLIVSPDYKAIGTPSDRSGRQAHIGIGCFAENISLALTAYGLIPTMELEQIQTDDKQFVGVKFDLSLLNKGLLINSNILSLIKLRRVYRGTYKKEQNIDSFFKQIIEKSAEEEGLYLKLITNHGLKTALSLIQFTANNIVLHLPEFRKELGEHLAPNNTQETRVMPGNTFGASDEDALEIHHKLSAGREFPGHFAAAFAQGDKQAILTSSAVGIISSPEDNPKYWIRTGMALEKIWLYAQSKGLGVGIMAGMVEANAIIHNKLKLVSGIHGIPTAVFRLGFPTKETWPRSPREQEVIYNES